MFPKNRYALLMKMDSVLCTLLRVYFWTFRLTVENEEAWLAYLKGGGRVLLCTWHQQFGAAIQHFKSYESFHPSLMISKSQDGEIIARIAEKQGWRAVRGSSSRDGGKALKEMIEQLKGSGLAAHVVDGPRGPAGVVKPGVISLARATGAAVVPFYTAADRAWYFQSWDRFMLPKPFARVTIRFGEMMHFPPGEEPRSFENQRSQLEVAMRPALISS
jgi:lysophospholipid acyltransferase (LPLAT)-like uncharacterized protein